MGLWNIFLLFYWIRRLSSLSALKQAIYNCPCEKQSVPGSKPHTSKYRTWDLLMIANVNRIGNCNLSYWNGIFVGIMGMREMRTFSSLKSSVNIIASTTLLINRFTAGRVPLQNFGGWFIFHNMIVCSVASLIDRLNSKVLLDN